MEDRINKVISVLNELFMIEDIDINSFNERFFYNKRNSSKLEYLEQVEPKLGIIESQNNCLGFSVCSLLATITDILADFRLSFIIENDIIKGVQKYE